MSQSNRNTGTPALSKVGGSTSRNDKGNDGASKVAKPDLYYGDRNKLEDWLNQMSLYFKFNEITKDQTLFASTYLRGRA